MIKLAIIIVCYDRPLALNRLLQSLSNAEYGVCEDIPLVISIDGGGASELLAIAENYKWKYGKKIIIRHKQNLGLRKHILLCGDLTETYENIIILEDDCYVSKNYYSFALSALHFYKGHSMIAGISLYSHAFNYSANLPFYPLIDGYDFFFMQVPSSLGQVWSKKQWRKFKNWYDKNNVIQKNDRLPEHVKSWPESSWKKYFYKFMICENIFFVYPVTSYLTNFGDIGTHLIKSTDYFQTTIEIKEKNIPLRFVNFDQSFNKYDAYFEILPDCLIHYGANISPNTVIDLYGTKQFELFNDKKYSLSLRDSNKVILQYDASLFPYPLNIILNLEGNFFTYAEVCDFQSMDYGKREELIMKTHCAAFEKGKESIQRSVKYKVGNYLTSPKKVFNKLFR